MINRSINFPGLAVLLVSYSLFWLLLTEAQFSSWVLGIVFIPFAIWLTVNLDRAYLHKSLHKFRWRSVPGFMLFLFWHSLKGGLLTFQMAIKPNLMNSTGLFTYKTRLEDGFGRVLLAEVLSLVPGTICVDLSEGLLTIHTLDLKSDPIPEVIQCEKQIAILLGLNNQL